LRPANAHRQPAQAARMCETRHSFGIRSPLIRAGSHGVTVRAHNA
jgi:hypothetical protein